MFASIGGAILGGVASSVVGSALNGGGSSGGASGAAQAANPFMGQYSIYQPMLQNLMTNPSSVTSLPGYQFTLNQGLDQVQATMAAKGMDLSGNMGTALTSFAENAAGNEYQNMFNNLALLSGATNGSPAAAGNILQGQNQLNQQAAAGIGNTVSSAFNNWWNPSSGGTGQMSWDLNGSGGANLDTYVWGS